MRVDICHFRRRYIKFHILQTTTAATNTISGHAVRCTLYCCIESKTYNPAVEMRALNPTDCINKKQQTEVLWSLIDRILSSLMIYRNLGLMISRRSLKDKKGQTWAFSLLRQWLLLSTPHHYLERMVWLNKKKETLLYNYFR